MTRDPQEQLIHFLKDMHSVEQQALAQMVSAPKLAGDPGFAEIFRIHHAETEQQAALLEQRLEAHGESSSALQDAIMKLGGKGFLLFAQLQPETPGRLAAHAYAYEAMEWAGYEMLQRFAQAAGDAETVAAGKTIGEQERTMMTRLEQNFDAAEAASHRDTPAEKMSEDLCKHVAEAHALESQGVQLLSKSEDIACDTQLAEVCRENLEKSREHLRLLEDHLGTLGTDASSLKDTALKLFGLNWGFFFQAQSDTPAKLAAFAYAFEHLKIAGYELLRRSARRAADAGTQRLAETLLTSERNMARASRGNFRLRRAGHARHAAKQIKQLPDSKFVYFFMIPGNTEKTRNLPNYSKAARSQPSPNRRKARSSSASIAAFGYKRRSNRAPRSTAARQREAWLKPCATDRKSCPSNLPGESRWRLPPPSPLRLLLTLTRASSCCSAGIEDETHWNPYLNASSPPPPEPFPFEPSALRFPPEDRYRMEVRSFDVADLRRFFDGMSC